MTHLKNYHCTAWRKRQRRLFHRSLGNHVISGIYVFLSAPAWASDVGSVARFSPFFVNSSTVHAPCCILLVQSTLRVQQMRRRSWRATLYSIYSTYLAALISVLLLPFFPPSLPIFPTCSPSETSRRQALCRALYKHAQQRPRIK